MKHTKKALSLLILSSTMLFSPLSAAFGGEQGDVDMNTLIGTAAGSVTVASEGKFSGVLSDAVDEEAVPNSLVGQPKVNINLASYEQLISLPGIGRVKAAAILNYRKEVGMFKVLEDIQNIKGIGQKLFVRLQDKIDI